MEGVSRIDVSPKAINGALRYGYERVVQASTQGKAFATLPITSQSMKRVCINIPDLEAAMLLEVQKVNKVYKDLEGLVLTQIH